MLKLTNIVKYYSKAYLVIRKCSILVYGIDLCDFGPDRLTLQHSLLFSLREEGNLVVHILQHDVDRRLWRQLLRSIVLNIPTNVYR